MRLFIATTFPTEVIADLNKHIDRASLPRASWVKPETQHLTFAFLGERDESLVDAIAPDLTQRMGDLPRFTASIKGAGLFRSRVGWAGLEPEQPFIDIAARVRDALMKHGVELDRDDFKPHLTLMRVRDRWPTTAADNFLGALRDYRSAPFVVDTVTLYSSRLNPAGAIHTPLRHFALA